MYSARERNASDLGIIERAVKDSRAGLGKAEHLLAARVGHDITVLPQCSARIVDTQHVCFG